MPSTCMCFGNLLHVTWAILPHGKTCTVWGGMRTTCVRQPYETHHGRTTIMHAYDMSYALLTHFVRLSYAILSYAALNMPAYDKNAQMSYVGVIAYDMSYVICTVSVRCCTYPNTLNRHGRQWGASRAGGKGAMLAHLHLRLQCRVQPVVHRDADDVHTRAVVWAHRTTCVQMPYDSDMCRTYSVRMSYVMVTVTKV